MALTVSSFFRTYITKPWDGSLSFKEKVKATIATVALGIFTLGIAQAMSWLWQAHLVKEKKAPEKSTLLALSTLGMNPIYPQMPSADEREFSRCGPLQFETIGTHLQDYLLHPYYQRPLPPAQEVMVPNPSSDDPPYVLWNLLSPQDKIRVNNSHTRPHNQLEDTSINRSLVDKLFMPGSQDPFLPHDPREHHGCDHAARVAILVPLFAHLYAKYSPECPALTKMHILLAQFIGAGHDSARQTEGPDVYDERSATHTIQALQAMGIEDQWALDEAKKAIQEKDQEELAEKSIISKLVQNADCAEFARLLLKGPEQDTAGFIRSESYLDIFKEISQIAQAQGDRPASDILLKGTLTYQDFRDELGALRSEINRFIFQTHNKAFRERVSTSETSYYDSLLSIIEPRSFPLISAILEKMGVKPVGRDRMVLLQQVQDTKILQETKSWLIQGIDTIETKTLQKLLMRLMQVTPSAELNTVRSTIERELQLRETKETDFLLSLELPREEIQAVVVAQFASLPHLLKEKYRSAFLDYIKMGDLSSLEESLSLFVQTEREHAALLQLLQKPKKDLRDARWMMERIRNLLEKLHNISLERQDPFVFTTCAVALEAATLLFLQNEQQEEAKEAVHLSTFIPLAQAHPIQVLCQAEDSPLHQPGKAVWVRSDCQSLRKRRIRLAERIVGENSYFELSFELTSKSREDFTRMLTLVDPTKIERVPARYLKKVEGNRYTEEQTVTMDEDLKIIHINDNIDIFVGATESNWNQYHLMRVQVKEGTPPHEIHQALASVGLSTALMISRDEDKRREALSRILSFRFPRLMPAGEPDKNPEVVYEGLPEEHRVRIDQDLAHVEETLVGPDHIEQTLPTLAPEAWRYGARSLGTFISAGDTKKTASVLADIFTSGFLSSEERFQKGIFGLGCVPKYNYCTGSGNQVFTRILSKNMLESRYMLDNFAIRGPIMLLLDLQALERMPYSYLADRGGIRNPEFFLPCCWAQKQKPIFNFKGREMIGQRPDFEWCIKALSEEHLPLNETMFDQTLGPQYIQSIVVTTEEDRQIVIQTLKERGIHEVRGTPVEYAVVATSCLHPSLIPHCDEEEMPMQPT